MSICNFAISRISQHLSARNLTDCLNLTSRILPLGMRLNPGLRSNLAKLSLHLRGLSSQILYFGFLAHLCLNLCSGPVERMIAGFGGMAGGNLRGERGNWSLY